MTLINRRHAIGSLTATAAAIAAPALAQADRRIVLGQSAAFSGPAAELGIQMNRGARLHFDAVNAAGGINGVQIELRTLDDQYEPDKCKANTEALIKDDVFALFGYVGTPTSLAALPLVNQARIPFFGPFTGAEALRDPFSRYVFHVRASYFDETALIVKQLTSLGLKKIAVFRQNDSYGQAGYDGVVRALKAQNLAPVAVGLVERNTVNVAAAVSAIVPAQPDAVVQISAYKSCAAFIREARKAGYGGTFYNVSFVGTQALADELGRQAVGVVVSQVVPFPFSMTTSLSREYLAAVQRAGGKNRPNYSSMEGYVAAKLFVEGMRRAGRTLTRDTLIAGLETVQSMDLGGFMVGYSNHSHVASRFVDLSMLTDDGRVRV
ncbi:MAG TPA: ABC transporter substrate-binding protein [Burkholderiaceae bacterium]|nr:ABC transporter substrate-binding protein [Burkholderiaceae bacterium]HSC01270.1 ABC transporter substrate-binding protein [Burkholderiaceae bacterium]